MDIDIAIGKKSLTLSVENPFHFDLAQLLQRISEFCGEKGLDIKKFGIEKLIPRMIRGVAGCEGGCPSDAKSFVREGFGDFSLSYVEGGILKAVQPLDNGDHLEIKIFPEF